MSNFWKVLIGLSFGAGFAFALALAHVLIAFGEMKSEVRRNGDNLMTIGKKLNAFEEKLDAFDKKLSDFGVSQARMEEKLEGVIRFVMNTEKGGNSASLDEKGSAENVSASRCM